MREERQRALVERLRILPGPQERLSALAARGRKLPALPPDERTEAHLVPGCVSRVWLAASVEAGAFHVRGDCEAALVKGLVALLCELVEGLPVEEVASLPDECPVWRELGLDGQISPTRLRGLAAVWRRLRGLATSPAQVDGGPSSGIVANGQ
ncbi:MAG: SufE family protein [Verrucomicrobia bacterium]|nr:SufE family protein [Verrucomicrobiota bacterium]